MARQDFLFKAYAVKRSATAKCYIYLSPGKYTSGKVDNYFIESKSLAFMDSYGPCQSDRVLDECLSHASYGYSGCRLMGDISMPHVRFLPEGTFRRYEDGVASTGRAMAQYKPAMMLRKDEMRSFLAVEAGRWEKEEGL